mgnify:CR=1 FL=1
MQCNGTKFKENTDFAITAVSQIERFIHCQKLRKKHRDGYLSEATAMIQRYLLVALRIIRSCEITIIHS